MINSDSLVNTQIDDNKTIYPSILEIYKQLIGNISADETPSGINLNVYNKETNSICTLINVYPTSISTDTIQDDKIEEVQTIKNDIVYSNIYYLRGDEDIIVHRLFEFINKMDIINYSELLMDMSKESIKNDDGSVSHIIDVHKAIAFLTKHCKV